MCGIAGIVKEDNSSDYLHKVLESMLLSISHRGPDDSDLWINKSNSVGLGHRRLSILDLSEAGRQPMHSSCGNLVMVFNGEIYNHLQLRTEIEENCNFNNWRGHSDTETLLECIRIYGLTNTLKRVKGMFAFAVYNKITNNLILARDRFGEKPLFYGLKDGIFFFASELKAIKCLPNLSFDISFRASQLYHQFSYIPDPYTIYENIHKLKPGTYLVINTLKIKSHNDFCIQEYWNCNDVVKSGIEKRMVSYNDDNEVVNQLDSLLSHSVKNQMISDVPIGAFLSGGIDSSLIVSLMQQHSVNPIKTFTVGFDESMYNEAEHARKVANFIGTDHHDIHINSSDCLELISDLNNVYDEPFADVSQLPSRLVSRFAKTKVTVCLSGDGGDELFGGYNRHFMTKMYWHKIKVLPLPLRKVMFKLINLLDFNTLNSIILKLTDNPGLYGQKLTKASKSLLASDAKDLYEILTNNFISKNPILSNQSKEFIRYNWTDLGDITDQFMLFDTTTYLPGDILVKMDRASMYESLETRIPFLDPDIFSFAWKLDQHHKIRDGKNKWILRELLYKKVPRELIDRPKMGFSVPIGNWLRGPLKEWALDLLNDNSLLNSSYYDKSFIDRLWKEHQSMKKNHDQKLWTILVYKNWLRSNNA